MEDISMRMVTGVLHNVLRVNHHLPCRLISGDTSMSNVYAIPVATPAFVPLFAATVSKFFPDSKVESLKSPARIMKRHPEAQFIDPPSWESVRPKHYLCIISPMTWEEIEKRMLLAPTFVQELVSLFGSADVGADNCEENQYLFYTAELLTVLGATRALHEAFAKKSSEASLTRVLSRVAGEKDRRHIYESVLGLNKGSYKTFLTEYCSELVDGATVPE